jgi:hypothetical protein
MADASRFVRRPLRTKVVLDHTEEMTVEEARLRGTALVFTVSGTRPALTPGQIGDGLMHDFPELPDGSFQVSLMHPGTFFTRFTEPSWFDLVAAKDSFRCRGTPILIRRWHRLTFATFRKYRYSVRLYLERLTPQAWSFDTVQRALPCCLIHSITEDTQAKSDLSFYVVEAWVDKLEDVPTETIIDIHEPRPCVDPLAHVPLPPGFSSPDVPIPGAGSPTTRCNADLWRSVPPRILSTTILVHLDSSMFIRPAPSSRGHWSRDDDDYYDGDDDTTRTDEVNYPWTHGVADDVWHQRLEAATSGAASGQHRPQPRNGGGRRRALLPAGFLQVPLPALAANGVTVGAEQLATSMQDLRVDSRPLADKVVAAPGREQAGSEPTDRTLTGPALTVVPEVGLVNGPTPIPPASPPRHGQLFLEEEATLMTLQATPVSSKMGPGDRASLGQTQDGQGSATEQPLPYAVESQGLTVAPATAPAARDE